MSSSVTPVLAPPGDPLASEAAIARSREKLAKIGPPPTRPPLSQAERASLWRVLEADSPRFVGRGAVADVTDEGGLFFARVRILRVISHLPFPPQTNYAAWTPAGPVALTGRPEALSSLCAYELPGHTGDLDLAFVLANHAGIWTAASVLSEVRLGSADDIPFRGGGEGEGEAEVRAKYAPLITPPGLDYLPDGVRVTMWVVSQSMLRQRVAEVRRGVVSVTEHVVDRLPVHEGRMWGQRNGRFVPIG